MKFKNNALFFLILITYSFQSYAQSNLNNLVSLSTWDSLFPKRAGTFGTHPQGYTYDFYSYNNLNQAVDEMSDYFVVIRTKAGVWGQLITITRKSTLQTYTYSNVDNWWYTNSTPENIVIVDFEDFLNKNSLTNNKRELSAFLANISKETTGGWQFPVGGGTSGDYASWGLYFVHEVGYTPSNSAGTYSQSHAEYPPNPNVGYYGRGPIQLSWNYNYGQFSKFIYNDKNTLLNYPDSILENGVLAFKSAIWFWMMPQCPKPSCHQVMHDEWKNDSSYSSQRMYYKGFAHTNNIINGGLECRTNSSNAFTQKVVLRSELYKYYLGIMGFNSLQIRNEDSAGYSTLCYSTSSDAMENYANCKVSNSYYGSFGIDSIVSCQEYQWIDSLIYTQNTKTAVYKISGGDKNGNDSLVILNLRINPNAKSLFSIKTCDSYKWIDGKTYTASTDSAQFIISGGAANGCDSLVTLNLTLTKIDIQVTQVNSTLSAPFSGEAFQWIDCNNGFSVILTETNSTFNATKNGRYAVIISNKNCIDTSDCYEISNLNLINHQSKESISVYPNPFNNLIQINIEGNTSSNYYITNLTGQIIQSNSLKNGLNIITMENYKAGIYFLFIDTKVIKLLKVD